MAEDSWIVQYGDTCWILDDGTTGRPIMGAGPSIKHFDTEDLANDAIDQFVEQGIYDREDFEMFASSE